MKKTMAVAIFIFIIFIDSGVYGLPPDLSSNTVFIRNFVFNLNRKLILDDLDYKEKNVLMLIRNAIYARHGYIFQSKDLRDFFSQFEWYKATRNNVNSLLNEIDIHNISLIVAVEKNYPHDDELIITQPTSFPERYYLFPKYNISEYFSGLWQFVYPDWPNEPRVAIIIDFCFNGIYHYSWKKLNVNEGRWESFEEIWGLWSIHNDKLKMTPFPNLPVMIDKSRFLELKYFTEIFEPNQRHGK
jgi:hypothetical protein